VLHAAESNHLSSNVRNMEKRPTQKSQFILQNISDLKRRLVNSDSAAGLNHVVSLDL
jgi:hypothetical protein